MDLLGQYQKNRPETTIGPSASSYKRTALPEGFLIRMVIKLSGGQVHNRQQALIILLVIAGMCLMAASFLVFQNVGITKHPIINAPPPETIGARGVNP